MFVPDQLENVTVVEGQKSSVLCGVYGDVSTRLQVISLYVLSLALDTVFVCHSLGDRSPSGVHRPKPRGTRWRITLSEFGLWGHHCICPPENFDILDICSLRLSGTAVKCSLSVIVLLRVKNG